MKLSTLQELLLLLQLLLFTVSEIHFLEIDFEMFIVPVIQKEELEIIDSFVEQDIVE